MVIFGDHEGLARHAINAQAGQVAAVFVRHHRRVGDVPVRAVPWPAREMRMLPVGMHIDKIVEGFTVGAGESAPGG